MQLDLAVRQERYLQKCPEPSSTIRTYATRAIGIDVVRRHKLLHTGHIDIMSNRERLQNHIRYRKIAQCIARYK